MYGGGSTFALVNASGCDPATAAFWVTSDMGGFITYVPGARVTVVNAPRDARFPRGIPANTAILARCRYGARPQRLTSLGSGD